MEQLSSAHLARLFKGRFRTTLVAALLTVVLALGAFSFAPTVHAASTPTAQGKYCQVVVAKVHPGERTSQVLSSRCVNHPLAPLAGYTLIMRLFAGYGYTGSYADYYGADGPCTNVAYYEVDDTYFSVVGSFWAFNECYNNEAFTGIYLTGQGYTWSYNPRYVGPPWNYKFWSFLSWY